MKNKELFQTRRVKNIKQIKLVNIKEYKQFKKDTMQLLITIQFTSLETERMQLEQNLCKKSNQFSWNPKIFKKPAISSDQHLPLK